MITGAPGVGKSVLFDHLRGAAPKIGYVPKGRSEGVEKQTIVGHGHRLAYHVVPGQASAPRLKALDDLFAGKDIIEGVIHVVAGGHAHVRGDTASAFAQQSGVSTLAQWLDIQKQAELEDLAETLRWVEQSHRMHQGNPKWFLVAVAKYDLYYDKRDEAAGFYQTDPGSAFVQKMNATLNRLGAQNFRWDTLPVSSYLDRYTSPVGNVQPQLTEPERDHLLTQMINEIEKRCE